MTLATRTLKKGLLIFSSFTVCLIALVYGVSPEWFYKSFLLDSSPPTLDQAHILRAVMMLYLSFGVFWFWCAFSDRFRDAAILMICIFCGGLVSGRILSLALDGTPSPLLIFYIFVEASVIPLCIWLLRREE